MKFTLVHAEARKLAIYAVGAAPDGFIVTIKEPKQSDEQRDKYHAMIDDIAKHEPAFTAEIWKRLLVDQFKAETLKDDELGKYWAKESVQIVQSLDRQRVVVLGEQTRNFPKYVSSAFIEWLSAWGADKGVRWSA